MTLPLNPGANSSAQLPEWITRLPQEAAINLLGQKTNCYLLHGKGGCWVVDPPSPNEVEINEILTGARGNVITILLTHTHPDHTGGVSELAKRTGAPVRAHPLAQAHLEPNLSFQPLNEGDVMENWQVYEMPGHRFDSLCFVDRVSGCAIAGDLVAGAGSVIIDTSDGDLADYLASLTRLRDEIRPSLLAPGHGPLIDDPQRLLTHFINHRLMREQLVVQALGSSPLSLRALLPTVYADTPEALYPLAERSLLTHLIKLEKEGRARQMADGWCGASAS